MTGAREGGGPAMPVGALEDGRTVPHAERSLKGTSNALRKLSIQTYLFLLYRI